MIREVYKYPSQVLRNISEDCDIENEKEILVQLIQDLKETMYDSNGVGLAAPQIGILKRVFVIDVDHLLEKDDEGNIISQKEGELKVFINPEFIEQSGSKTYEEGCLSVPGVYENVKRYERVKVRYFDENFEEKEIESDEFLAIVIQHENDHLLGKLFIDRLPTVKRTIIKKRLQKAAL